MLRLSDLENVVPIDVKEFKKLGYSELFVYKYEYKFGKSNIDGKRLLSYSTYDKETNILTSHICSEGIFGREKKQILRYNDNNMLLEVTVYNGIGDPKRDVYEYNDKGQLTRLLGYYGQAGLRESLVYEYGVTGLKSREEWCLLTSLADKKHIRKYNDKGFMVEDLEYEYDRLIWKCVFEYNNKDLLIKRISYRRDGEVFSITIYKYNDKGLCVEEGVNYPYDSVWRNDKRLYVYNDMGLLTEETFGSDEKPTYIRKSKYNDKGLLIEKWWYDLNNDLSNYGYKYQYNDNDVLVEETKYGSLEEPIETTVYEYKQDLKESGETGDNEKLERENRSLYLVISLDKEREGFDIINTEKQRELDDFLKKLMLPLTHLNPTYSRREVERIVKNIKGWSDTILEAETTSNTPQYLIIQFDKIREDFTVVNIDKQEELNEFLKKLLKSGDYGKVGFACKCFEYMLGDIDQWVRALTMGPGGDSGMIVHREWLKYGKTIFFPWGYDERT
jgi:hypothetical protein